MKILGISAYYHDSAAALIDGTKILAAVQEERFTRKKHDADFPMNSIRYCLESQGLKLSQLDHVVFYEKPTLKFDRLLHTQLAMAPFGLESFLASIPLWLRKKLFQRRLLVSSLRAIDPGFDPARLLFSEHHLSHAASAYYPSPFASAAIVTMDGVGEWATSSIALGKGNDLEIIKEIRFPHSLGLLYSAFTAYAGFKVNSGEYKLMGLAPYGRPVYADAIFDKLIDIKEDGSFRLHLEYFDYCKAIRMSNERFHELFGGPPRSEGEPLTQRHMDLAASIQVVTESIVLRIARAVARETGEKNLCLAGGVALNCVANGKLLREKIFDRIWIQPAAGDAGGALGAAFAAQHLHARQPRHTSDLESDLMSGGFLGPRFEQSEIESRLAKVGAVFRTHGDAETLEAAAAALADEKVVGWFQGRMEFGPRSLGGRSILGDPRSPKTQSVLNLKIKFRESFRPFAPSVLREEAANWFDLDRESPYMLLVTDVLAKHQRRMSADEEKLFGIEKLNVVRSAIPAVTHVDYSARVQTVSRDTNPRFYDLIRGFQKRTGCPVVVNTSFNVRGEPIVCTPEDAFRCFMGTDMDTLVVGNCILEKSAQDPALKLNYKDRFELD